MKNETLIEELNQLLKGSHMGACILEDLRDKLNSKELKDVFNQIIGNLNLHEKSLTALVISEKGNPIDTAGFAGMMVDMMQSLKNLSIKNDEDILKEAVKSMEMAVKAITDFSDQHDILSENMQKTVCIMKDDYESMYHMLHKYLIEYMM